MGMMTEEQWQKHLQHLRLLGRIFDWGMASIVVLAVMVSITIVEMRESAPEQKAVSVHTRNNVFEGTLEGKAFQVKLSFDGKREAYSVREGDEHKYLISVDEGGYCFQIDGNALLQMPKGASVCKRNQ